MIELQDRRDDDELRLVLLGVLLQAGHQDEPGQEVQPHVRGELAGHITGREGLEFRVQSYTFYIFYLTKYISIEITVDDRFILQIILLLGCLFSSSEM